VTESSSGEKGLIEGFAPGSVAHTLMQLRGTWHDHVELFSLDGEALEDDSAAGSGTPGKSPFDNLVYIDFDGEVMTQTNICFRGRESSAKTFGGRVVDGILVFDSLGPGAIENVGVSGGPNILFYNPRIMDERWHTYLEPDFIMVTGPDRRVRTTVLYRDGEAKRSLTAYGQRLSKDCLRRHEWDPRGPDGPVHEAPFQTSVWASHVKT